MNAVVDEANTIIRNVEGTITKVVDAAYQQIASELAVIEHDILVIVKNDIEIMIVKVSAGATVEQIETELLNLWAQNRVDIIQALSSGALQVLITMAKMAVAS